MRAGWLSSCEPSFAEAILDRLRVQVLEAGEPLYHPGDLAIGIYGVLSGSFAASFGVAEFGPTLSHLHLPGAWFGESAYLRQPRVMGVHATRTARIAILFNRDIDSVIIAEPRRWAYFASLAVLNGQLAMGAAYDLMLRDPQARCVATLLRLAGYRHAPPREEVPVELDITQAELAHMTNLSRNSVGAILRLLRERNCVDMDYRQLLITDPAILRQQLTGADA